MEADIADALAGLDAAIEADLAAMPEVSGETESAEDRLADLRRELWRDPGVRRTLDELWPALTPQRLSRSCSPTRTGSPPPLPA